jgi:putative endonuclease
MTWIGVASPGVKNDPRHALGQLGERLAAEHLSRRGYEILERNFRTKWGELDLVAYDGRVLVFCEVKSRRLSTGHTAVFEALHTRKRAQVRRMAGVWLFERADRPRADELRFDAIGVVFDLAGSLVALEHLEGAF